MNPAPTLLSEWLTPTGFGIIVALLLIVAVIVAIAENVRAARETLSQERLDALLDEHVQGQLDRYHCAAHGCSLEVTSSDSRGTRWSCVNCGATSWVPCTSVFDQSEELGHHGEQGRAS